MSRLGASRGAEYATRPPSPALKPFERRLLVGAATGEQPLDAAAFANFASRGLISGSATGEVLSPHGVNALVWTKRARVATMRAMLGPSPSLPQGDHFEPAITRAARQLDRAWKAMGCCHSGHLAECVRVGGLCPCSDCGWPYRLHPHDWAELSTIGGQEPFPYLHVACDGRRVKL